MIEIIGSILAFILSVFAILVTGMVIIIAIVNIAADIIEAFR